MDIEIIKSDLGIFGKVLLSKSAYSSEALIKVTYNFTDDLYIFISEDTNNYVVNITPIKDVTNINDVLLKACGKFINELADQEIRQIVLKETGHIRETIVAAAFSEAAKGLNPTMKTVNIPESKHSYLDDKLGIIELKG
jgi:His-Xaa-Ser system protein HxsD